VSTTDTVSERAIEPIPDQTAEGRSGSEAAWADRAMRWAQLTLVDDDPRAGSGYSTEFWLDYFRDIRADAACLSAGGYMAFYPTDVPGHRRSIQLGDTDPFGDLVAGCRDQGMVVMARVDPHALHDDVARLHPEWVAHDLDGTPIPHWAAPDLWLTCPFGPYSTEFIRDVNEEIMTRYDVDAIFANRWTGTGRCYCEFCRTAFRAATGYEIPAAAAAGSEPRVLPTEEKAYRAWRQESLLRIARDWDAQIRAIRPSARFIPNSGGGALSDLNMDLLAKQTETLFADKQARSGLTPVWENGRHGKEFRAVMGAKAIGGIFSVGIEEIPRWKDSVQTAEEIRIWVATATANGMRSWFTKFGGTVPDPRWLEPVGDIFRWQAEHEEHLRNTKPIANVGLVYSQQTARMFGGASAREFVESPVLGFYQALVEARIPFEMVHDERLDPESLGEFETLILPNVASLSDRQCQQLRDFVANGGGIVATQQTSLFDENGAQRENFGLAELFGADFAGTVRGPLNNSYLELHPQAGAEGADLGSVHPLLVGLEGTTRIINGVHVVDVVPRSATEPAPVTLIDSFPDLPMEEVYRRDWAVGVPQAFVTRVGEGTVVYFPGDLDRSLHEYFTRDHQHLIVNAIRLVGKNGPAVQVTGAGILEVTAWEQEGSMTVHLVNLTNPNYLKAPYTQFVPSPSQTVRATLPAGRTASRVRLLRAGIEVQPSIEDGVLTVEVESVSDFEIVAIDF
jgi:hypothetical protein